MKKVRIRVDHSWLAEGRGEGTVLRMGRNFEVTDCDIFATGAAMRLGQYGVVANNHMLAMKINTELGGSQNVIVENNQFVSMDPTDVSKHRRPGSKHLLLPQPPREFIRSSG